MRLLLAWLIALNLAGAAEDKFRLVRETDALTPDLEQTKLHAPVGFTVQLFASEPMINKPINMAFDARGRLWVSSTVEYPYAAAKDRWADALGSRVKDSRDAIKILEDSNGNGEADKVTNFADGLNIPTGVLPWHKPEHNDGCIAWSIPNIWYFADTDGDGKCDKREVLFGPLGYEKDTHGMCSSFRLGLDGWVYATHGFNNTSHLKAKDGSTLDLHSGNVFRFRPDGSHVEIYSWGQVNPFGLCWDRYGNLYSADCHSNPITQLIRGAHYPSFGKPHDGLGYAPNMCEHSHGSTGLCGIIYIDGGIWGPEWDDHMFLGNCVTSTVNHDKITFTGSTPKANEQPDFITSDDPWFRPVDLQLGPDNALYIADFYNKIIGHYEVPLDHPGRDKERGRIWRVVRNGHLRQPPPIEGARYLDLVHLANETNLTIRHLGHPQKMLLDDPMPQLLTAPTAPSWIILSDEWRLNAANRKAGKKYRGPIFSSVQSGPEDAIIVALQQVTEYGYDEGFTVDEVLKCLAYDSARVRRWSATVLQAWPDTSAQAALIGAVAKADAAKDVSLIHALKLALREHLRLPGAFASLTEDERKLVVDVAKAVPSAEAASFLFDIWSNNESKDSGSVLLGLIAKNADEATLQQAIARGHEQLHGQEAVSAAEAVSAMHNGLLERGSPPPPTLLAWATELAESLLAVEQSHDPHWSHLPHPTHPTHPADESPWCLEERKCADGVTVQVISSLDKDKKSPEKLTGILRSKAFAAPAKLSFWLCGHLGFPAAKANQKNLVRLVAGDDVGDGVRSPDGDKTTSSATDSSRRPLRTAFPPRNDVCQRIEWDLADLRGQQVRLEVVDGDDGTAYAWLGITRIEPAVVSVESFTSDNEKQKQLRTLAGILKTTAPVGLRDKLAPYLPKPAVAPAPPKPRPELDALIASRRAAYVKAKPDIAKGETIFKTNCAVCHAVKGQGGVIGPQLDGVGSRGTDRLIEDILDPNRNVDAHFHLHQLKLRDGSVATGFIRGEVGQVMILVDAANNEQRISKGDIAEDTDLPQSLMPPTFGQTISTEAFNDLIGWLLTR